MTIPPELHDIFAFLDKTDAVIESRYIWTGPKTIIETNALLAAVLEVRTKVKSNHEAAGVMVHATKALP